MYISSYQFKMLKISYLVLSEFFLTSISFNFDTKNFVVHYGSKNGSLFGFSVAQYKDDDNSWVLVGAPKADSRVNKWDDHESGAVYFCDVTKNDSCNEISIDTGGEQEFNNRYYRYKEYKSRQWLGATVKSSGQKVLVCAPQFTNYINGRTNLPFPIGKCFVASKNFTRIHPYLYCGDSSANKQLNCSNIKNSSMCIAYQGFCEAGFSADFSKDGETVYVSAVFSNYGAGRVFKHNLQSDIITSSGVEKIKDLYNGYSVTSGHLGLNDNEKYIAAGVPNENQFRGKILLYNNSDFGVSFQSVSGEQMGSYFGYALTTADVNGDGLDDLIVGAPLYSHQSSSINSDFETGRVYIFYQNSNKMAPFNEDSKVVIDGVIRRGRFGLALTSLGDINRDGYTDIAVAAPYNELSGLGAVYIYHGSLQGMYTTPTQVIHAEDIPKPVSAFGFSLSGGVDLDDNFYPDLVIGAYESDAAFLFRTRPIAEVEASIKFEKKDIDLSKTDCLLDGKPSACLNLTVHFSYNGISVDDQLTFNIQLQLDILLPESSRMVFVNNSKTNNHTIKIKKGEKFTLPVEVHTKPGIKDKFTHIQAEMIYNLLDTDQSNPESRNNIKLSTLLDPSVNNVRKDSVKIKIDCRSDSVCYPDLQIKEITNTEEFIVGLSEVIVINATIENVGDDAFESVMNILLPPNMDYKNYTRIDGNSVVITPSPPVIVNHTYIQFDIGNQFPKNKPVKFELTFQPRKVDTGKLKSSYDFYITVESSNSEFNSSTMEDNTKSIQVNVTVQADIILTGFSSPDYLLHFNASKYNLNLNLNENDVKESQIGPQVRHTYHIRNKGPSEIKAKTSFLWPNSTYNGEPLIYLLNIHPVGNISCSTPNKIKSICKASTREKKLPMSLPGNESTGMLNLLDKDNADNMKNQQICQKVKCSRIICEVGPLTADQDVSITFDSRVFVKTLSQFPRGFEIIVSSIGTVQIMSPYVDHTPFKITKNTTEIFTRMMLDSQLSQVIALWKIVIAACTGAIIFLCICFLLFKCGFFNRNRPEDPFAKKNVQVNSNNVGSTLSGSLVEQSNIVPSDS